MNEEILSPDKNGRFIKTDKLQGRSKPQPTHEEEAWEDFDDFQDFNVDAPEYDNTAITPTELLLPEKRRKILKTRHEHTSLEEAAEAPESFMERFSQEPREVAEPVNELENSETKKILDTKELKTRNILSAKNSEGSEGESSKQQRHHLVTPLEAPLEELPDLHTPTQKKKTAEYDDSPKYDYFTYDIDTKRRKVFSFFREQRISSFLRLCVFFIIALIMFIISFIPEVAAAISGAAELNILGGSGLAYALINLVLLLIEFVIIGKPIVKGGVTALLKGRPDADSVVSLLWLTVLIQNIILVIMPDSIAENCWLYSSAVAAMTVPVLIVRFMILDKTQRGFSLIKPDRLLYSAAEIEDEETANHIGKGIIDKGAKISFFSRISLPKDYINLSLCDDASVSITKKLLPVCYIGAAAVGLIAGIKFKNAATAASAFTAAVCTSLPLYVGISLSVLMWKENKLLIKKKAVITSYNSAIKLLSSDAVIFDAVDLYNNQACTIHGVKPCNGLRIEDAILYAAAMYIKSEGPLGLVFNEVIAGKLELLPQVEELLYEEKLGLSAWINNRKVLIGCRELMLHHNVEPLSEETEDKFKKDGKQVLYLAIESALAAAFIVSYNVDAQQAKHIKLLINQGISILLRSTDPFVTAAFVEEQLGLPEDTIKVISPAAAESFVAYREGSPFADKAGVFNDGSPKAIAASLSSALTLHSTVKLTPIMSAAAAAIGLFYNTILSIFSDSLTVSNYDIFLLQLAFSGGIIAINYAISNMKNKFRSK